MYWAGVLDWYGICTVSAGMLYDGVGLTGVVWG